MFSSILWKFKYGIYHSSDKFTTGETLIIIPSSFPGKTLRLREVNWFSQATQSTETEPSSGLNHLN